MELSVVAISERRAGRPVTPAKPGEKVTLSVRVRPGMKDRLRDIGEAEGANLSDEVERRLEFAEQTRGLLADVLLLETGNRELAGFAMAVLRTITAISGRAAIAAEQDYGATDRRFRIPFVFNQIVEGINLIAESMRPPGPVDFPATTGNARMLPTPRQPNNYGKFVAAGILEAIANPDAVNPPDLPDEQKNYERKSFARKAAELLGEAVLKHMKAKVPDPMSFVKAKEP